MLRMMRAWSAVAAMTMVSALGGCSDRPTPGMEGQEAVPVSAPAAGAGVAAGLDFIQQ